MKLIKLELLSKIIDTTKPEGSSYQNVLEELNISFEEDSDMHFRPVFINTNLLKEEMLNICDRLEQPEHCVVEFFDGRTFIVNQTKESLAKLLDDTLEV
jgi:hypothetical protein